MAYPGFLEGLAIPLAVWRSLLPIFTAGQNLTLQIKKISKMVVFGEITG